MITIKCANGATFNVGDGDVHEKQRVLVVSTPQGTRTFAKWYATAVDDKRGRKRGRK